MQTIIKIVNVDNKDYPLEMLFNREERYMCDKCGDYPTAIFEMVPTEYDYQSRIFLCGSCLPECPTHSE